MIDLEPRSMVWHRPIGQFVHRDPHCILDSDMSTGSKDIHTGGLGGSIPVFQAMWRLSKADIVSQGLDPVYLRDQGADFGDDNQLHVNIGEFLAIVINIWLALALARQRSTPPDGWIWLALADNTSALSWMRYASHTRSAVIMALARFLTALIAFAPFPVNLQGSHIQGVKNIGPDAISRPQEFPSWASIFEAAPALASFKAAFLFLSACLKVKVQLC